jgi:hypothetical protein
MFATGDWPMLFTCRLSLPSRPLRGRAAITTPVERVARPTIRRCALLAIASLASFTVVYATIAAMTKHSLGRTVKIKSKPPLDIFEPWDVLRPD